VKRSKKAWREIRPTISREIVRPQPSTTARGPTKAKTHVFDDLVVVVLEETFTHAERRSRRRARGWLRVRVHPDRVMTAGDRAREGGEAPNGWKGTS
jgi:uncharacterized protein YbcI